MPHKIYHGKTGVIYNVTKSSVGIIMYKKVKHRYMEKRINVKVEHIRLSRSREDFLRRVKENAEAKKQAKAEGKMAILKRQPGLPREARFVSMENNKPITLTPVTYQTSI